MFLMSGSRMEMGHTKDDSRHADGEPSGEYNLSSIQDNKNLLRSYPSRNSVAATVDSENSYSDDEDDFRSSRSLRKSVSFSTIEIRTYNVTIGDHPGSHNSYGTPISLCWDYDVRNVKVLDVLSFEDKKKRRSPHELYLRPNTREWMLSGIHGYSQEEIDAAAKEAEKLRNQRNKTRLVNKFCPLRIQEVIRCVNKKVASRLHKKGKVKSEL